MVTYFYPNQTRHKMNVDSLKSELQQVLDNDVVLRKEFNELKRSLSDYRNQLIMRDEDCKRLQVTIDVLNTKLVVMERDNTNYKAELASFKELRGSIKEQLDAKQQEIDARVSEIQSLRNELASLSEQHAAELEQTREQASFELSKVKEEYEERIGGLKSAAAARELAIREELEAKMAESGSSWNHKEQELINLHHAELSALRSNLEEQITSLTSEYNAQLEGMSAASANELAIVREGFISEINSLKAAFEQNESVAQNEFRTKVNELEEALVTQRTGLVNEYAVQFENLQSQAQESEKALRESFEGRIVELESALQAATEGAELRESEQINAIRSEYETLLASKLEEHELRMAEISAEYESKLSNTLIHSNSQNSRFSEDFAKVQSELESALVENRNLITSLDVRNSEYALLELRLLSSETQLSEGSARFQQLLGEFEQFRSQSAMSSSEQVNVLNLEIENIQLAHSQVVGELEGTIAELRQEIHNLSEVVEGMTNSLAEAERNLEYKNEELDRKSVDLDGAMNRLMATENQLNEINNLHFSELSRLTAENEEQLAHVKNEYDKLLVENKGVIEEIEASQLRIEGQESELQLLRSELEDTRKKEVEKAEEYREIVSEKNFKITNLEAVAAALREEIAQLKSENDGLRQQMNVQEEQFNQHAVASAELSVVSEENTQLQAKINEFESTVAFLNERIQSVEADLESKNELISQHENAYGTAMADLEALSQERLTLLNEKEEMANQLLKMNDVIGQISHQVEANQIDVVDLNNHRKNVILAGNSGGTDDRSAMKKQINELVREIDKCISLLSA